MSDTVVVTRRIDASPATVFSFFSDIDRWTQWQGVDGVVDARPGGAFYVYPKCPWGTAAEFVQEAIRHNLLIIPGTAFSRRDTHFRVSYAATDEKLRQGVAILKTLSRLR